MTLMMEDHSEDCEKCSHYLDFVLCLHLLREHIFSVLGLVLFNFLILVFK